MKTLEQWRASNLDLGEFLKPGDEVDEELYDHMLGCLPPERQQGFGFLVGEPYTHTDRGPLFDAFYHGPGDAFKYGGLKTTKEFMDADAWEFPLKSCCATCDGSRRPGWLVDNRKLFWWTHCPECHPHKPEEMIFMDRVRENDRLYCQEEEPKQ